MCEKRMYIHFRMKRSFNVQRRKTLVQSFQGSKIDALHRGESNKGTLGE